MPCIDLSNLRYLSLAMGALIIAVTLSAAGCGGLFEDLDDLDFGPEENNQISCDQGLISCDGQCIEPDTDGDHCGECDNSCGDAQCTDGVCEDSCTSGFQACDGECVDLDDDINHCGSCDNRCPDVDSGTPACANGTCTPQCQEGFDACDEQCVDTASDDDYCGSCDISCSGDETCIDSECTLTCESQDDCPEGTPPYFCEDNICVQQCDFGFERCDGSCIDVQSDAENCGSCGYECTDTNCVTGECSTCDPTAFFDGEDSEDYNFGGGQGTALNPYQLCSAQQLVDINRQNNFRDKAFALHSDLDFSNITNFSGIGSTNIPFTGSLEGHGFAISNLNATGLAGIFNTLGGSTSAATIRNLELADFTITANDGETVGALAGSAPNAFISGIVADNIDISAATEVGGLIGHAGEATIIEDLDMTAITLTADDSTDSGSVFGGIVGLLEGTVRDSRIRDIKINDGTTHLGGLAGTVRSRARVVRSMANATISSSSATKVGALVGEHGGVIRECYATGMVHGESDIGGLVGHHYLMTENFGHDIVDSYATTEVNGSTRIGGLVGQSYSRVQTPTSIRRSYAAGPVSGPDDAEYVHGFVGRLNGEIVTNSVWDTDTTNQARGAPAPGAATPPDLTGLATGAFATDDPFPLTWNFQNTWMIGEAPDGHDRPILQWQSQ